MNEKFWRGKRVFLTGHTGFKGAWLALWLHRLGARIFGFALPPPTSPSLFDLAKIESLLHEHVVADLRDQEAIAHAISQSKPQIVLHLAAQPLVRRSYADPQETYAVNVMGLVHLLEAVRCAPDVAAVLIITSDKCYENREWLWSYRENEALGGHDPYSSSKACAEIVAAAYRRSFLQERGIALATARSGNVIGGGDWAADRLIPDALAAFSAGHPIFLRHPQSVRPWQHVLEPLSGYLMLAEKLYTEGETYAEAWNFGPADADARPVHWLIERLAFHCDFPSTPWQSDAAKHPHEARLLKLDASKAHTRLGWQPRWSLDAALLRTAEWHRHWQNGNDLQKVSLRHILDFEAACHD